MQLERPRAPPEPMLDGPVAHASENNDGRREGGGLTEPGVHLALCAAVLEDVRQMRELGRVKVLHPQEKSWVRGL